MISLDGGQLVTVPSPGGPAHHPRRIRTFHVRRGRVSGRHLDALGRFWPRYGVTIGAEPASLLDAPRLFGRCAPLVLEIGSGMGESTVAMAIADPGRDYLAVEVHPPGVANLLALIADRGVTNVRIAHGDALDLLRHQLPVESLDAIHIFFPDPWPKSRHQKRRLIQPAHVALMRSRLSPGGTLHCATDAPSYAHSMMATLTAASGLSNVYEDFAPRPPWRPVTKFELRALDEGRAVFDLAFRRER